MLGSLSISTKIDVIGNEGIMLPQKAVTPSSSKSCWDFELNEDFLIVNCGRGELSPYLALNKSKYTF